MRRDLKEVALDENGEFGNPGAPTFVIIDYVVQQPLDLVYRLFVVVMSGSSPPVLYMVS